MKSFTHTVQSESGLHARPASLLAYEAKKYQSRITLIHENRTAGANSMLAIMAMSIKAGADIEIIIAGPDEEKAYEELLIFFRENV